MSFGGKTAGWIARILMILVSACSTGANTGGTAQDAVKIRLVTEPDPPHVGNGKLNIDVTDAAGQPIDNLKIDVSMDMTGMSMGAQAGLADDQGKGRFTFAVTFHRQGEYKVQLWVRRNGDLLKNDEITFQVN